MARRMGGTAGGRRNARRRCSDMTGRANARRGTKAGRSCQVTGRCRAGSSCGAGKLVLQHPPKHLVHLPVYKAKGQERGWDFELSKCLIPFRGIVTFKEGLLPRLTSSSLARSGEVGQVCMSNKHCRLPDQLPQ
jgi:hypothetical protein